MKSIREYHEATKHSWEKLYQDSHTLDWSNQPNPFRTYPDCPRIDLGSSFEKLHSPLSSVWSFRDTKPKNEPITLNHRFHRYYKLGLFIFGMESEVKGFLVSF